MRLIKTKRSFRKEFKRQLRYAIAAAVGFMVVFVWKEAIWNSTTRFVEQFQETTKFVTSEVLSAIVISVVGVLLIVISSKLLKDK